MARAIAVSVLVLVLVGLLGWYLGWFHVTSNQNDTQPSLTVTVDKAKVKQDENAAQQKVQDAAHQVKDKIDETVEKHSTPTTQPAPQP